MSLAMPEEATRTVVCAAAGETATPSAAMSATNQPPAMQKFLA
jgi:hypothetical protein